MISSSSFHEHFIIKYKPKSLKDFHFDEPFIYMINSFIECMNTQSLNLLFMGNTGSCKTIFLHTIIRNYYNIESNEPLPINNILFINNLKEQGINYYRTEMKIFCQSHTAIYGKKKIVVIDDIDTINEQNQQVFRNCMDKYSHNIHFIASCSNIQKVIESIQSRLQIIKLPLITPEYIKTLMNRILENENIYIESDAKDFLLNISNNSLRVMINYLEKITLSYNNVKNEEPYCITTELCKKLCTDIPYKVFEDYTLQVKNGNLTEAIELFYNIFDYGYSVIDILYNYFLFIKITNVLNEDEKYHIIPFLCKYITVFHNIHEDNIELALFTGGICSIIKKMRGDGQSPP